MTILNRTNSENKDFQDLVLELDQDLANKNGEIKEAYVFIATILSNQKKKLNTAIQLKNGIV